MRLKEKVLASLSLTALFSAPLAFADQYAPHAGQVDTDGILSPGEYKNPNIDYDRAQRKHERNGDFRVDNPINDAAADDDRRYEPNWKRSWDRHHDEYRERDERARREEEDYQRNRDNRSSSWWPF